MFRKKNYCLYSYTRNIGRPKKHFFQVQFFITSLFLTSQTECKSDIKVVCMQAFENCPNRLYILFCKLVNTRVSKKAIEQFLPDDMLCIHMYVLYMGDVIEQDDTICLNSTMMGYVCVTCAPSKIDAFTKQQSVDMVCSCSATILIFMCSICILNF